MSLDSIGFYQPVLMAPPWPTAPPGANIPRAQAALSISPTAAPAPLNPFDSFTTAPTKPTPTQKTPHKSSKIEDWVLKRSKPLYMPEASTPLTQLARQLAEKSGIQQPFKVVVVNKPNYNAAAFANGTIIFNVDTLKRAQSPEELAFILAHELSHVQFEDSKARKKRYGVATAAAFILEEGTTFVFGVRSLLKVLGLSIAAPAAAFQWFAYKERQDEARADVNAIRLLSKAGYATSGYRSAFENMGQDMSKASWWMHLQWKIFGEDHPALPKRKLSVEQAIAQQPFTWDNKPCMSAESWNRLKSAASRVVTAKK